MTSYWANRLFKKFPISFLSYTYFTLIVKIGFELSVIQNFYLIKGKCLPIHSRSEIIKFASDNLLMFIFIDFFTRHGVNFRYKKHFSSLPFIFGYSVTHGALTAENTLRKKGRKSDISHMSRLKFQSRFMTSRLIYVLCLFWDPCLISASSRSSCIFNE